MWFWIVNGHILSLYDRVIYPPHYSGWVLSVHILFSAFSRNIYLFQHVLSHSTCINGKFECSGEHCTGICEDNEYVCDNGVCILDEYICDGIADCNDGSDEENCGMILKGMHAFSEELF